MAQLGIAAMPATEGDIPMSNETESRLTLDEHYLDNDGNPEGGITAAIGILISWQRGPLGRIGTAERKQPNGAFVEDVIHAARARLDFYQSSQFACDENAEAIKHLNRALDALAARTKRRIIAKTEGTHEGQ